MREHDKRGRDGRTVYIYKLIDPLTHEVRYIGKAYDPDRRLEAHLRHALQRPDTRKGSWIEGLRRQGAHPVLQVIDEATPETWPDVERSHIKNYLRAGYALTNDVHNAQHGWREWADRTSGVADNIGAGTRHAAHDVTVGARTAAGRTSDAAQAIAGVTALGTKIAADRMAGGAKAAAGALSDGAKAAAGGVEKVVEDPIVRDVMRTVAVTAATMLTNFVVGSSIDKLTAGRRKPGKKPR